jgi:uroporphyrinogen III methyltransferase/synthase
VTVYLVGAGPGDPGLFTRRGAELLSRAEVVVYDRLIDHSLLSLAPKHAILVDAGKRPAAGVEADSEAARQEDINALLVAYGQAGRMVVRLKGGDPFLFGRGGEEAAALTRAGVDWEVVPGVSSALAVPATAGIPVTHRGLSSAVTVVTGRVGEPIRAGVDWEWLARANGTLVILMGMATRGEIARRLIAGGRLPEEPVAVIEWGTTPRQRVVRTTLAELEAVVLGSPATIVVGPVARLALQPPGRGPLRGRSVVVTRAPAQAGTLTAGLRQAGARVIELPVIEIGEVPEERQALEGAAEEAGRYEWLVFTSSNAVGRFVPLVADLRRLASCRIAAVGRATATALAEHHLRPDLVPEQPSAESLVRAMPEGRGRVLFVKAAGATETLATGLRAKGWQVDEVIAYRTVEASAPRAEVAAMVGQADAVTFASPSAVRAFLHLRDTDGRRLPVPPVVACIGPTTAAAARAAGITVAVEPSRASVEGLVAALVAHFGAVPAGPGRGGS